MRLLPLSSVTFTLLTLFSLFFFYGIILFLYAKCIRKNVKAIEHSIVKLCSYLLTKIIRRSECEEIRYSINCFSYLTYFCSKVFWVVLVLFQSLEVKLFDQTSRIFHQCSKFKSFMISVFRLIKKIYKVAFLSRFCTKGTRAGKGWTAAAKENGLRCFHTR